MESSNEIVVNDYKIPSWCGKPPLGLHLDVLKEGKLVQKLMIDDKKYYTFGRNKALCDFSVEHQSCSRIHAILLWHKVLERAFLVDLNSIHGTFIGRIRLEAYTPQQLPIGAEIKFGASTRSYIIRESPKNISSQEERSYIGPEFKPSSSNEKESDTSLTELPETEYEIDNLTEFNTALNRRLTSINMNNSFGDVIPNKKKKKLNVHFNDQEEIINPEDVDPSVGRFRNLVQETFIPNKKKSEAKGGANMGISSIKYLSKNHSNTFTVKVPNQEAESIQQDEETTNPNFLLASKLGLPMPNLAPEPESFSIITPSQNLVHSMHQKKQIKENSVNKEEIAKKMNSEYSNETRKDDIHIDSKKKYLKEAWPGKRPGYLVGT